MLRAPRVSYRNAIAVLVVIVVGSGCSSPTDSEVTSTTEVAAAATIPESLLTQISNDAVRDIPFSEDEIRQSLDVYLPAEGDGPHPTILAIHGGGFRARSKSLYDEIGPYYAANGVAFVATNYRLTPGHSYPAQVEDSFCALAWVHQNAAEYGFDPDRVVVWGGSAGGYLASMVATVNDPSVYLENCPNEYPSGDAIQAAVIFYGLYDFTNVDDFPSYDVTGGLRAFWGAAYEEIPVERLEEMSPIVQIDGTEPPFLLLHGTADTSVPSVMSERFAEALEQAGVQVELVLLPGVGHAFELQPLTSDEMTLAFNKVGEFLDQNLDP